MKGWSVAALLLTSCTIVPSSRLARCDVTPNPTAAGDTVRAPLMDHHQHLLNEGTRAVTVEYLRSLGLDSYALEITEEPLVDADQLVQALDSAGIAQALVLSSAYFYARSADEQVGEQERVRADNDWTLEQVRRHPTRLFAACSVNPRRAYSIAEIERCAATGGFRALKIHFDASGVDVTNAEHLATVRRAFEAANRVGLPIIVHLQSEAGAYGGEQARIFLENILPVATSVPVTVNHLWGGGLYNDGAKEALAVLAAAVKRGDPSTRNLFFDLAQASMMVLEQSDRAELVQRMREIGFGRLLYGSDGPQFSGVPAKQHWDEFRSCLPTTREELTAISQSVAPYLKLSR